MASSIPVFVGMDVGASRTKAVVLDADKHLFEIAVEKSGTDFTLVADLCLTTALKMAGASKSNIVKSISTGYGRKKVSFAQ